MTEQEQKKTDKADDSLSWERLQELIPELKELLDGIDWTRYTEAKHG